MAIQVPSAASEHFRRGAGLPNKELKLTSAALRDGRSQLNSSVLQTHRGVRE
jgi:hypothetical protein